MVNIEYGKKVLHTSHANYSFQKLHNVLKAAIELVIPDVPNNGHVLNLGMGGGSAITILREELNFHGPIVSVEHDPVIVKIAKNEFDIERFSDHEMIIQDAEKFIFDNIGAKFDLIVCDLFKDKIVPVKFRSDEFLIALINQVENKGHLIFNFIKEKNQPTFFETILDKNSEAYSFFILKPTKENHVMILSKN